MIAQRMHTLLPDLSQDEAIELAAMRSLVNRPSFDTLDYAAPLEAPHHSASMVSVIGGGSGVPKPGLASLASHGVLFLDEAPEFSTVTIDALRQPLESGDIIFTGTPDGVGAARGQFLKAGDVIDSGAEVIGTLRNTCVEK